VSYCDEVIVLSGRRLWVGLAGAGGVLLSEVACSGSGTPDSPVTVTATTVSTPSTSAPLPSLPRAGVVPNVVGLNHQLAQDTMQAAGFYKLTEEDATGKGRLLVNDRNWVVVTQEPAAGTQATADSTIILRSKKIGE
jgi:hypothetical protein